MEPWVEPRLGSVPITNFNVLPYSRLYIHTIMRMSHEQHNVFCAAAVPPLASRAPRVRVRVAAQHLLRAAPSEQPSRACSPRPMLALLRGSTAPARCSASAAPPLARTMAAPRLLLRAGLTGCHHKLPARIHSAGLHGLARPPLAVRQPACQTTSCCLGRRHLSTQQQQDPEQEQEQEQPQAAQQAETVDLLLYRGRWILPIRWSLRLKLFQAAGALSVANLMFVDPSSSADILVATSLVGGIGGVTYSLWWFARAYAGELRLLVIPPEETVPSAPFLLLSVLDFWGNRFDRILTLGQWGTPLHGTYLSDAVPGGALAEARKKPFLPVRIGPPLAKYEAETVFVSLNPMHSDVARVSPEAQLIFEQLLSGEWDGELPPNAQVEK